MARATRFLLRPHNYSYGSLETKRKLGRKQIARETRRGKGEAATKHRISVREHKKMIAKNLYQISPSYIVMYPHIFRFHRTDRSHVLYGWYTLVLNLLSNLHFSWCVFIFIVVRPCSSFSNNIHYSHNFVFSSLLLALFIAFTETDSVNI